MACKYLEIGQGFDKAWGVNSLMQWNTQSIICWRNPCLSLAPSTFARVDSTTTAAENHCWNEGERKGGAIGFCTIPVLQRSSANTSLKLSSRRAWLSGQCGKAYRTSSFWLQWALKLSQVISLKGTLGLQLCCSQVVWTLEQSWGQYFYLWKFNFFLSEADRIIFIVWGRNRKTWLASQCT